MFFFFFQAEDGIRDIGVTGVQTCALPISEQPRHGAARLDQVGQRGAAGLEQVGQSVVERVEVRGDVVLDEADLEIGRASGRERVEISVVAVSLKKKTDNSPLSDLQVSSIT